MTPVLFTGHGAPFQAFRGQTGIAIKAWGERLKRPEALLFFSAHWRSRNDLSLGAVDYPHVYNDVGLPGLPAYPAPSAIGWAERVATQLTPRYAAIGRDESRGWDHGVWSMLYNLFPQADVPVLQLSLPMWDYAELIELGQILAPLRSQGLMIIGSGQLAHDMTRRLTQAQSEELEAWLLARVESGDLSGLANARKNAPHFALAHASDEHFTPLLVAAGAASGGYRRVDYPVQGYELASFPDRSIEWG